MYKISYLYQCLKLHVFQNFLINVARRLKKLLKFLKSSQNNYQVKISTSKLNLKAHNICIKPLLRP